MEQNTPQGTSGNGGDGRKGGNDRNKHRNKFPKRQGPRPEKASGEDADGGENTGRTNIVAAASNTESISAGTQDTANNDQRREPRQGQERGQNRIDNRSKQGGEATGAEPKLADLRQQYRQEKREQANKDGGNKDGGREQNREARGGRNDRPKAEAQDRNDRTQRPAREERPDRGDRTQRPPRPDRPQRPDRSDRPGRSERTEGENMTDDSVFETPAAVSLRSTSFQNRLPKKDNPTWGAKVEAKAPANERELMTIGITIGDLNGIGPELILKLAQEHTIVNLFRLVVYGNNHAFNKWRKHLNIEDSPFLLHHEGEGFSYKKVTLVNAWEQDYDITPGKATPEGGEAAWASLQMAVRDAQAGLLDAIVTAPISKANMPAAFTWPGHTEYFAESFKADDGLMLLVAGSLRLALATVHTPLQEVPKILSTPHLEDRLSVLAQALKQDFGITKPRIAVLGLNPHAGEEGKLGKEEQEIILPLLEKLQTKGHLFFGPYPADGFFGARQYSQFDAVLAMYHDQGLTPFKTLAFDEGVNYTAGLPFVRTSPDHGTAFNIAGKGTASTTSLLEAIYLADEIVKRRKGLK